MKKRWSGAKCLRNLMAFGMVGNMVIMNYDNAILFGVLFLIVAIAYDVIK